jgi:actin-related protein
MSAEAQPNTEQKPNDKEYNFRQIEKRLAEERAEKERLSREKAELAQALEEARRGQKIEDEDDDSEPYVDKKRLNKTLVNLEKKFEDKIEKKAEEKARKMLDEEKKNYWLDANRDFYDVMQHAEKLVQKAPELAETILKMPEGFERQKLVYSNIKALGLDKPEAKAPSIQEKIDANRRSPYYQPSGVSSPPHSVAGDFSPSGQKNAYEKMKELQNRLRI